MSLAIGDALCAREMRAFDEAVMALHNAAYTEEDPEDPMMARVVLRRAALRVEDTTRDIRRALDGR